MIKPPLILTLALDTEGFQFFQALRQQHFPPERNFIDAHLTLFHALPNEDHIIAAVKDAGSHYAPFVLAVTKPVSIGNGVAFKIDSPELIQLHKELQNTWFELLTMQDRQTLWPHITIQNKVPSIKAQSLLGELKGNFTSFTVQAKGLQIWEYLNGPWKPIQTVHF